MMVTTMETNDTAPMTSLMSHCSQSGSLVLSSTTTGDNNDNEDEQHSTDDGQWTGNDDNKQAMGTTTNRQ
jgi:hypothetical protein